MAETLVRVQDTANGKSTFHLDHIDTGPAVPPATDQDNVFFLARNRGHNHCTLLQGAERSLAYCRCLFEENSLKFPS